MSMIPALTMGLLAFVSVILIFIVLLQRGRGGGLAGALGGAGGASAFGTKAGDVFTRITIVLAVIWVLLGAINVVLLRNMTSNRFGGGAEAGAQATLTAPKNGDEAAGGGNAGGGAETVFPGPDNGGTATGSTTPEAKPAPENKPAGGATQPEPKNEAATPEAPKEEPKPEAPQPEVKPETPKEEAKQPE